jgi:pyruvate,water dikinase
MSQCKGLISEKGSLLSHTAIIGRELGIPTVVGLKGVTNSVKQDAKIRINGKTGEVSLLSGDSNED